MPNEILKETGWQSRVRDKMGVDVAYLPDALIEQPEYARAAELIVLHAIGTPVPLGAVTDESVVSATVCQCAALLCPIMKVRLPKVERGVSFQREVSMNWDSLAQKLIADRDMFLGFFLGDVPDFTRFGLTYQGE